LSTAARQQPENIVEEAVNARSRARGKARATTTTKRPNNSNKSGNWRMKQVARQSIRSKITATPANIRAIYNQISGQVVLNENPISQPRAVNVFSEKKVGEVAEFFRDPTLRGTSGDASLRASQIMSRIATFFSALQKTYHSGKGDDFESVAVTFGNPSIPISLSAAGTLSPDKTVMMKGGRKPSNTYGTLNAMRVYGGHYITVNLSFDAKMDAITGAIHPEYELPAALAPGGKGLGRVQMDYVIVIPAKREPGTRRLIRRCKVIIIEFKAGENQINMAKEEEQQAYKGAYLFQNWWADDEVEVEIYYSPYLADMSRSNLPRSWNFQFANYLTFEGLIQMLKLDITVTRALSDMRAEFLTGNVGGTGSAVTGIVRQIRNAMIQQERRANNRNMLPPNTGAQILSRLEAASAGIAAATAAGYAQPPNSWSKFKQFNSSVPNWKGRSDRILFLLAKRDAEVLKNKSNNSATQANSLIKIAAILHAILKANGDNARRRILTEAERTRIYNQLVQIRDALRINTSQINAMSTQFLAKLNLPRNKNVAKNYFISFIKARAKYLGRRPGLVPNQTGNKNFWGSPGSVNPIYIKRASTGVPPLVRAPTPRGSAITYQFKNKNQKLAILERVADNARGFEAAYREFLTSHVTPGVNNMGNFSAISRNMAKYLSSTAAGINDPNTKSAYMNMLSRKTGVENNVQRAHKASIPAAPIAGSKRKA
jgi:hypothetical protein